MVRSKYPFRGTENNVGLMEEILLSDSTPMMKICPHCVFFGPTMYPGVYYAEQTFRVNFGKLPGSYSLDRELIRILSGYFRLVAPAGFAPSEEAKGDARRAVGISSG